MKIKFSSNVYYRKLVFHTKTFLLDEIYRIFIIHLFLFMFIDSDNSISSSDLKELKVKGSKRSFGAIFAL